jgi:hypothetical protein
MRRALALVVSLASACGAGAPAAAPLSEPAPAPVAEPAPAPVTEPAPVAEPAPDAPPADVASALASRGELSFTDGTLVYTMRADHTFEARPTGMSGPTIDGRWRRSDAGDLYEVFGHWGWLNGASRADDFRRLRVSIRAPFVRADVGPLWSERIVYRGFFVTDELTPISAAEHEAGLASCR